MVRSPSAFSLPEFPAELLPSLLKADTTSRASNADILSFFSKTPLLIDRLRYIRESYKVVFTELLLEDDTRVGFYKESNGLLVWQGSYLTRSAESHLSWHSVTAAINMERKKTRLNESEMKVMQIIWNAGHPITGQQVLGQITEQYKGSWHPRTIYPLMRKLSEKGMIRDVGSARVGKVYARQFLPAISRPEYMALRIMETLPEAELPQFLSYFSY